MEIAAAGREDATTTFARDQWMLLACGEDSIARARVWRRDGEGLLLGRFHRADPAACVPRSSSSATSESASRAGETPGEGGLSRRLSGGRIVPVGPDVVCLTMAAPLVDWFDAAGGRLRPDQVLNRALRPLLAALRGLGVEAYYPGRDLITAAGRILAHASFTVMRDGVALVEAQVAEGPAFPGLPALLDRLDPASVAGVDRAALGDATSLRQLDVAATADEQWAARLAAAARESLSCEATVVDAPALPGVAARPTDPARQPEPPNQPESARQSDSGWTPADQSAARDFLLSPGPLPEGSLLASTVAMLGVVECSARMRGDRLNGLEVTGDLIAPFHTIEAVTQECEGQPFRPANVRKALARAMAHPRSFLLGLRELDELILRMA